MNTQLVVGGINKISARFIKGVQQLEGSISVPIFPTARTTQLKRRDTEPCAGR